MKKLLTLSLLALMCVNVFAQQVVLVFTGRDVNNSYCQLSRVSVTNLTKGWQEIIYWPDTTLSMQHGTGINENVTNAAFGLSQNIPNPFNGSTDVNLNTAEKGSVMMEVTDMNGRTLMTKVFEELQPGRHQFRLNVAASGIYFLTARQNSQISSIKMVCNESRMESAIDYIGKEQTITFQLKVGTRGETTNPFTFGDHMEYVGYATINGDEEESQRITQEQGTSQTFVLQFSVEQAQLPTVTTLQVTDIAQTSATLSGNVTADGGATVSDRGVCYNTIGTPTLSDGCLHVGAGLGLFSQNVTGLTTNTTYYVRAFAVNAAGVVYGNPVQFTTTEYLLPSVTTLPITNITQTTAICGGNVTADGGITVTDRGVCYNTTGNPTITDGCLHIGTGLGGFNDMLTSLTLNTTYYVRAFAINAVGVVYGNEETFTTLDVLTDGQPCPGTPTLTDVDGNSYNTVLIGSQCWMKENLKTTKYADNTPISQGSSTSTTTAYWYYPNGSSSNKTTYGLLYNWKAVMRNSSSSSSNPSGVQGICPTGWHVPSDAEWTQLTDYVSSQSQYYCTNTSYIAKALAATTGWSSYTGSGANKACFPGYNSASNNATGFSALPAGYFYGSYSGFGNFANYWSATEYDSSSAYYRYLYYGDANVNRNGLNKYYGFSVRCVRD